MANSTVSVNTQNISDNFKFEVVKGPTGINAISISNTANVSIFDPYKTPGNPLDLQAKENIFGLVRPYLNVASFSTHFGNPDQYLTISPGGVVSFDTKNGTNNAIYFVNNLEFNDWDIGLVSNVTSDPFNYYFDSYGPALFFNQEVIWSVNSISNWNNDKPYKSFLMDRYDGPTWEKNNTSNNQNYYRFELDSGNYYITNNNSTYNSLSISAYPIAPRRNTSRGGHIYLRTQDNPSWNDSSIFQMSYYSTNGSYHSTDYSLMGTTVPSFMLGTNAHSVNNVIVYENVESNVVFESTEINGIIQGGNLVFNHTLLTNGFKLLTGTFIESEEARSYRSNFGSGYNRYMYSLTLPQNITQSLNLIDRIYNGFATTNNENVHCHLRSRENVGISANTLITLDFVFSGSNTSSLTPLNDSASALQVTWMMIGR